MLKAKKDVIADDKKDTQPEKPKTIHVKVRDMDVDVKEGWRDDFEVILLIGYIDKGNLMAIKPLYDRVLGEESANKVINSLRGDDGIIHVTDVENWFIELVDALNAKN